MILTRGGGHGQDQNCYCRGGNCASSLVQGLEYYRRHHYNGQVETLGLMHFDLGGYTPEDIEVVAAFDVDRRKVGKPLYEAIFAKPNCTKVFQTYSPPGSWSLWERF